MQNIQANNPQPCEYTDLCSIYCSFSRWKLQKYYRVYQHQSQRTTYNSEFDKNFDFFREFAEIYPRPLSIFEISLGHRKIFKNFPRALRALGKIFENFPLPSGNFKNCPRARVNFWANSLKKSKFLVRISIVKDIFCKIFPLKFSDLQL